MVAVHVVKLFVVAAFESKASISVPAEVVATNTWVWKQEEKKIGQVRAIICNPSQFLLFPRPSLSHTHALRGAGILLFIGRSEIHQGTSASFKF